MVALFLSPIYLLVNYYVYCRSLRWLGNFHGLLRRKGFRIGYGILYWFVSLSVVTSFVLPIGKFQHFLKALSNCWLGVFLYALLFLSIADLLKIILRQMGKIPRREQANPKLFAIAGSVVAACILTVSLYGIFHVFELKTTEYEIALPKACAAGDLTIALVADLHLGYNVGERQVEEMARQINQMQPDLVCLAGDIFDNEYDALDDPDGIVAALQSIQSRYGTFACYGNHDISERLLSGFTFGKKSEKTSDPRMDKLLADAGVQLLEDQAVLVDEAFYVVGRRDFQKPGTTDGSRLSPAELTAGIDLEKPVIVIDHQPRELNELAAAGVDLDLSGHTHDGQIFPGNLTVKLAWENPYGLLQIGPMYSVVTSGAGVWGPAMRIGTDSEVALVKVQFAGTSPDGLQTK